MLHCRCPPSQPEEGGEHLWQLKGDLQCVMQRCHDTRQAHERPHRKNGVVRKRCEDDSIDGDDECEERVWWKQRGRNESLCWSKKQELKLKWDDGCAWCGILRWTAYDMRAAIEVPASWSQWHIVMSEEVLCWQCEWRRWHMMGRLPMIAWNGNEHFRTPFYAQEFHPKLHNRWRSLWNSNAEQSDCTKRSGWGASTGQPDPKDRASCLAWASWDKEIRSALWGCVWWQNITNHCFDIESER